MTSGAQLREHEFVVTGMTCVGCAQSIKRALKRRPGIDSVSVHVPASRCLVAFDESLTDRRSVAKWIRETGFDVVEDQSREDAGNQLGDGDAAASAVQRAERRSTVNLLVGLALTVPLFILSMGRDFGLWGAWAAADWVDFLMFAMATPVQFWVGRDFYTGSIRALRTGMANMDVLILLGTSSAYGLSVVVMMALFAGNSLFGNHVYFETSATVVTLVIAGHWIESRAQAKTNGAITALLGLQSKSARVLRGDREVDVPVDEVRVGETVLIRPGERVPLDGEVIEGHTEIDERMLTGESIPRHKSVGDRVVGATINCDGVIRVQVTAANHESTLSRIVKQVETAQSTKAPIQRLADQVSAVFVPIVAFVAVVTFIYWSVFVGDGIAATLRMIAVLIISCPCAMGLATPLAVTVGMGRGAQLGVLFKSAEAIQKLRSVNHFVFDKTGTLTEGTPSITDVIAAEGETDQQVVAFAASLENGSQHPVGLAIVSYAQELKIDVPASTDLSSTAGGGMTGWLSGERFRVGNERFVKLSPSDAECWTSKASELKSQAKTLIWVQRGETIIGLIAVRDRMKPEAMEVVEQLKRRGVETTLLTGDNTETANIIGNELRIGHIVAEVLPEAKASLIAELQRSGESVGMVGDGINDAPALATADVGVAIGSGTDVAIEAADVTLPGSSLSGVINAVRLSDATIRNVKQNLFWAFAYNVLLIPVAAGVLCNVEFLPVWLRELHPITAALAMVCSDLVIVTNALRLRRFS
ncbi:MAG: heavy metal translocating P-type ATPase [Planctomycetota bacterium]